MTALMDMHAGRTIRFTLTRLPTTPEGRADFTALSKELGKFTRTLRGARTLGPLPGLQYAYRIERNPAGAGFHLHALGWADRDAVESFGDHSAALTVVVRAAWDGREASARRLATAEFAHQTTREAAAAVLDYDTKDYFDADTRADSLEVNNRRLYRRTVGFKAPSSGDRVDDFNSAFEISPRDREHQEPQRWFDQFSVAVANGTEPPPEPSDPSEPPEPPQPPSEPSGPPEPSGSPDPSWDRARRERWRGRLRRSGQAAYEMGFELTHEYFARWDAQKEAEFLEDRASHRAYWRDYYLNPTYRTCVDRPMFTWRDLQ